MTHEIVGRKALAILNALEREGKMNLFNWITDDTSIEEIEEAVKYIKKHRMEVNRENNDIGRISDGNKRTGQKKKGWER